MTSLAHPLPKQTPALALVLAASIAVTYSLYSLAFNAPWFFDDGQNLRGLAEVSDLPTAWAFLFAGVASEIGRPIANLTFLLNTLDWPDNPAGFRHIGTLFHILNGLLLAWAALVTARLIPALRPRATFFAVFLASAWLLHPLLFSTTLMPVQRMTVLAGTFTLLGLLLYVLGRTHLAENRWRSGLLLCSLGIALGIGLGILAKENAILLPLLVLVLETTVLRRLRVAAPNLLWRMWIGIFLVAPPLVLAGYIVANWAGVLGTYEMRAFSLEERLGAQALILWEYLRLILIPDVTRLGPFHDDVTGIPLLSPVSLLAIAAWITALVAAVLLRRKAPVLLFGLLWFLAGHVLESTVWPLELYFEHRNYIPSIGPLAVIIGFASLHARLSWTAWVVVAVLGILLWRTTSLWADPLLAAEMQLAERPQSVRATQFAAMQYDAIADHGSVLTIIDRGTARIPQASDLHATRLQLACRYGNEELVQIAIHDIYRYLPEMHASYAFSDALRNAFGNVLEGRCSSLHLDDFLEISSAAFENRKIRALGMLMHHLHHFRAEVMLEQGDSIGAIEEMRQALSYSRNPETVMMIAGLMSGEGLGAEAIDFFDQSMQEMPLRVRKRRDDWRAVAREVRHQICANAEGHCEEIELPSMILAR